MSTPNSLGDSLHVLVLDEEPLVLQSTRARLHALGHVVTTRSSARNSLDVIEQCKPDLVLVDVLMPDLSGDELFLLLARTPACVILHTPLTLRMLRTVANIHDALGVIRKTSNDEQFRVAFESVCERFEGLRRGSIPAAPSYAPSVSGTHRIGSPVAIDASFFSARERTRR